MPMEYLLIISVLTPLSSVMRKALHIYEILFLDILQFVVTLNGTWKIIFLIY